MEEATERNEMTRMRREGKTHDDTTLGTHAPNSRHWIVVRWLVVVLLCSHINSGSRQARGGIIQRDTRQFGQMVCVCIIHGLTFTVLLLVVPPMFV